MTKQKRHGGRNSEGASITDKVRAREERDGLIRCGKSGNTVGVGQRILSEVATSEEGGTPQ